MFNEQWFRKHQEILVWFANTWLGRRVLYINGDRSSVGKNKITGILPWVITWREGKYDKAEFRTYHKFSRRLWYGLQPLWKLIHIWDMVFANNFVPNWNLGFDEPPIFASAGNGDVQAANATYSTARNSAGVSPDYTTNPMNLLQHQSNSFEGNFYIMRGFTPFITSGLDETKTIIQAVVSLVFTGVTNPDTGATAGLVLTTQASMTSITATDYSALTLNSPTEGMTRKLLSDFVVDSSTYTNFILNATGISWIDMVGNTKLGWRVGGEIDNTPPASGKQNYCQCYNQSETGTSKDPKLVVTFPAVGAGILSLGQLQ